MLQQGRVRAVKAAFGITGVSRIWAHRDLGTLGTASSKMFLGLSPDLRMPTPSLLLRADWGMLHTCTAGLGEWLFKWLAERELAGGVLVGFGSSGLELCEAV